MELRREGMIGEAGGLFFLPLTASGGVKGWAEEENREGLDRQTQGATLSQGLITGVKWKGSVMQGRFEGESSSQTLGRYRGEGRVKVEQREGRQTGKRRQSQTGGRK